MNLKVLFSSSRRPLFKKIDLLSIGVVLIGVLWGIKQRCYLPAVPVLAPDSWGYLNPVLSWLSGAGFQQAYGREWLYPAILASSVKISGSFESIVSLQHSLGLLGAPLLWLGVRVWLSIFVNRSELCHGVGVILGAIAAFVYVLSTTQIQLELTIAPEGVLAPFVLLTLISALAYFKARWLSRRTWSAVVFGTSTLLLCYCVTLLRPSWTLALLPTAALFLVGLFGHTKRSLRFAPVVVAILLTGGIVILPNLLGFRPDVGSRTLLPFNLVAIYAAQIVENAQHHHLLDATGNRPDNIEARFYEELEQAWKESRTVPTVHHTLGFDPNYILYKKNLLWTFKAENNLSDDAMIKLCYAAYFRVCLESPGAVIAKIGKEIWLFLAAPIKDFSAYSLGKNRLLYIAIPSNTSPQACLAEAESRGYTNNPACISYCAELEKVLQENWHLKHIAIQRYLAVIFAKLAGWIQLLFFIAIIPISLNRRLRGLLPPALAATIVAAILYGNVLTISIAHTLAVDRYRASYTPALLFTLVIMTTVLVAVCEAWYRQIRSRE
jgi:hypothetical protein